jgi:hypothetical protein
MKERGIIFSGPMVRALLEGRKTQTRRIVKHQGIVDNPAFPDLKIIQLGSTQAWLNSQPDHPQHISKFSPYGQSGDRLWVKETFCPVHDGDYGGTNWVDYRATPRYSESHPAGWENAPNDPEALKWKPSIFMPRWASRILLEITGVRVERLQDISEEDASAEGCAAMEGCMWHTFEEADAGISMHAHTARDAYEALWESINGDGSWSANPFCWVISFRRI